MERILRLPEIVFTTGLSRSSIYRSIKSGNFPPPVSLGARATGWLQSDVTSWMDSRKYRTANSDGAK